MFIIDAIGVISSIVSLIVSIVAVTIAHRSLKQKMAADLRSQWWSKWSWSVEKALTSENEQLRALAWRELASIPLDESATKPEVEMVKSVALEIIKKEEKKK